MNLDYYKTSAFFKPASEYEDNEVFSSGAATPAYFCCPITKKLMRDPVVNPLNGVSYEKTAAIENDIKNTIPNIKLKSIIEDFVLQLPQSEENYWCSCTMELMADPVLTADGQTYEHGFIQNWLINKQKDTSPNTNVKLNNKNLIPNENLKSAIKDFIKSKQANVERKIEIKQDITCNINVQQKHNQALEQKPNLENKTETKKDISCNIKALNKLATAGDADAQVRLALNYLYGYLVPMNHNKAKHWLSLAKNAIDTPAGLLAQGLCYEIGHEVNLNFSEAFNYYKKAAAHNYAPAQFKQGISHFEIPSSISLNDALHCLQLAANNGGFALAQYALGSLYDEGIEGLKNPKLAKKYYMLAAAQGFPNAYTNLGVMYEVEKQNYETALEYYKLAAGLHEPQALNNLGHYYTEIDNNIEMGLKYFKLAASSRNGQALYNLGLIYAAGRNAPPNTELAIEYFKSAIENLNPHDKPRYSEAINALGLCYATKITKEEDNCNKAIKYFQAAASNGMIEAYFNLGECYSYNNKQKEAFLCYQSAAKDIKNQVYPRALYRLSRFYKDGIVVVQDTTRADKYFKLAARHGITADHINDSLVFVGASTTNPRSKDPAPFIKY